MLYVSLPQRKVSHVGNIVYVSVDDSEFSRTVIITKIVELLFEEFKMDGYACLILRKWL